MIGAPSGKKYAPPVPTETHAKLGQLPASQGQTVAHWSASGQEASHESLGVELD
jgi:hypothetical protein